MAVNGDVIAGAATRKIPSQFSSQVGRLAKSAAVLPVLVLAQGQSVDFRVLPKWNPLRLIFNFIFFCGCCSALNGSLPYRSVASKFTPYLSDLGNFQQHSTTSSGKEPRCTRMNMPL